MLSETQKKMYDLLKKRAFSKHELSDIIQVSVKTIENNIAELKNLIEEDIVHVSQESGAIRYYLTSVSTFDDFTSKKKKFSFIESKSGNPGLYIKIPDDVYFFDPDRKKNAIVIIPVADLHYGSIYSDVEKFKGWIDWIDKSEHVFPFCIGDLMDQSTKLSVADGVFQQNLTPQDQIYESAKLLYPISDKLLFLTRGNHERRQTIVGLDVMETVANLIHCLYKRMACHFLIEWRGKEWLFYAWHGAFTGWTEGGKINSALRPRNFVEADIYVSAHVHDKTVKEFRYQIFDKTQMKSVLIKKYAVITGSFLKYFGTYAQEKGYAPGVTGCANIKLFEDGDVHIGT